MSHRKAALLACVLVLTLMVVSCGVGAPTATPKPPTKTKPPAGPSMTLPAVSTATPSPVATLSPTSQRAKSPTATSSLTFAPPTPTLDNWVIGPENLANIQEIAPIGAVSEAVIGGDIAQAAWSPDGKWLGVSVYNGLLILKSDTLETVYSFSDVMSHTPFVFSADSKLIALRDANEMLQIRSIANGKVVSTAQNIGWFWAISPDLSRVASQDGVWDVATGQRLNTFSPVFFIQEEYPDDFDLAIFSPDGQRLVADTIGGGFYTWDAGTGELIFSFAGVDYFKNCASASSNGGWLVSVCTQYYEDYNKADLIIWYTDASKEKDARLFSLINILDAGYSSFQIIPGTDLLGWIKGDGMVFYNLAEGFRQERIIGFLPIPENFSFNPADQGKTLVAWQDRTLQIWDTVSGDLLRELVLPKARAPVSAYSLAVSPLTAEHMLAIGKADGSIEIWDVAANRMLSRIEAHPEWAGALAFSPDGRKLASSGWYETTLKVWDVTTGEKLYAFDHQVYLLQIAFSPDGKWLAAGKQGVVILLDAQTGEVMMELQVGPGAPSTSQSAYPTALAFSPGGGLLAVGSSDGSVNIWDLSVPTLLYSLATDTQAVRNLSFSPDGRMLVSSSTNINAVQVWGVESGKLLASLQTDEFVFGTAFSPDGCTLAVSLRNRILAWDVTTQKVVTTVGGYLDGLLEVEFSPDGHWLVAPNGDGTIRVWGFPGALKAPAGIIPQIGCAPLPIPPDTPTPTATPVTPTPTPATYMRKLYLQDPPMSGADVWEVQQRLLELGYSEIGEPDGIFGALTDGAVRRFQQVNGLEVDGIVGPKTWEQLFSDEAIGVTP